MSAPPVTLPVAVKRVRYETVPVPSGSCCSIGAMLVLSKPTTWTPVGSATAGASVTGERPAGSFSTTGLAGPVEVVPVDVRGASRQVRHANDVAVRVVAVGLRGRADRAR